MTHWILTLLTLLPLANHALDGSILLQELFNDRAFIQPIEAIAQEDDFTATLIKDTPEAVVHPVTFPKSYQQEIPNFSDRGELRDYPAESLIVDGYIFDYTDLSQVEDLSMTEVLDNNEVAYLNRHGMHTFFGHYYNLTDNGVFNPLADEDLAYLGAEIIVTDADGYSKGYELTDIVELLHAEQDQHFYGYDFLANLAYHGNGLEMVYIQYCRWDIDLGLLIGNVGYRVW